MTEPEKPQPPCVICGEPIDIQRFPGGGEWRGGHNAWPVKEGKCCTACKEDWVILARLRQLQEGK